MKTKQLMIINLIASIASFLLINIIYSYPKDVPYFSKESIFKSLPIAIIGFVVFTGYIFYIKSKEKRS